MPWAGFLLLSYTPLFLLPEGRESRLRSVTKGRCFIPILPAALCSLLLACVTQALAPTGELGAGPDACGEGVWSHLR